jgi:hypothetical protein
MSVLFMDGFAHYETAEITLKWAACDNALVFPTGGRRAGSGAVCITGAGQWIRSMAFAGLTNRIVIGTAIKPSATASGYLYLMSGTTVQLTLAWDFDGSLTLYRGTEAGTELASADPGTLPSAVWSYIEIDATIHESTGAVEVRLNGSTVDALTVSSTDTQPGVTTGVDRFKFYSATSGSNYFADIYVDSDTLQGDCAVYTLMPSGVGASDDFIPSAGSNYENVDDENLIDDDATYNSSTTQGDKDTFAFDNLPALGVSSTILAVAVNLALRKDDAATRQLKPVVRIGSPSDSQPFEDADVNGAQFGYQQSLVS